MTTSSVNFTENEVFSLSKTILVYASKQNTYATVHDVGLDADGRPFILPGKAATKEAIASIAKSLIKNVRLGGYLPDNVLSVGVDSLVWWIRPQTKRVFFKCSEFGGERTAETPHPGLVFHVSGNDWSVYAVKGKDRPTPETELFLAPYFNVWSGGKICTGNVTTPGKTTEESIKGWTEAFFNSYFTHPNVHTPSKLVNYKGGSYAFWQSMLDGKHKNFPEKVLVPMNRTLATLFDNISR